MLDLLLRYVTVRNLLIAAMLIAAVPFGTRFYKFTHGRYMKALYPPVRDTSSSAKDIKKILEQRQAEKIASHYRHVLALIAQAKTDGYAVSALERKASAAMAANRPGSRDISERMLSETEMATPPKKERYIPLYPPAPNEMMPDDDEPPKAFARAAHVAGKTNKATRPARKTRGNHKR